MGLGIDLLGFGIFMWTGLVVWQANAVSSTLSITAVYFLVTRYSFRAHSQVFTYVVFVAWYGCSIVAFSVLIQYATTASDWEPMVWKLLSVPVSFAINYIFSRWLFRRGGTGIASTGPVPAQLEP
ncbi:GtrA family protein [Cryobacterium sp. Hh7]|uniref:GtrA family protein n=1 Tax=Cryobacterium sp. Hh7 TaxID=1259159 RepID=UPI00351A595D